MSTTAMIFGDLTPIEVTVQIGSIRYTLREATSEAAARYRNHVMASTTFGSDGKPTGVRGLGDLQPLLVHLCLFIEGTDNHVPLDMVKGWPERIVKPIFERAKEISELSEEEESIEALEKKLAKAREKAEILKNGPASTEATSS